MIERRRRAAAAAWDLRDGIVLVGAGQPIPIPGRGDPTYPFRAHTEYVYLTDRERPGGVLAFDPDDGWSDFVAPVTDDERLWEGGGASDGLPLPELAGWLERRAGRPLACLGVPYTDGNAALTEWTRHALDAVRRPKNEVELERMRAAERATAAGFAALPGLLEPGRTERAVQIELEATFLRSGADRLAYDTIVGSGPNSAVLHFPPSARRMEARDLVLVDASAEVGGYASDVTRALIGFGGIRHEENVLVTEGEPEVLTSDIGS